MRGQGVAGLYQVTTYFRRGFVQFHKYVYTYIHTSSGPFSISHAVRCCSVEPSSLKLSTTRSSLYSPNGQHKNRFSCTLPNREGDVASSAVAGSAEQHVIQQQQHSTCAGTKIPHTSGEWLSPRTIVCKNQTSAYRSHQPKHHTSETSRCTDISSTLDEPI